MSEVIDNQARRKQALQRVIKRLHDGASVEDVKAEFAALLKNVGASEIAAVEQALIDEGLPETEVKRLCDVHVAVFRESLDAQPSPESIPGHPIHTFRAENAAAAPVLDGLEQALDALKADPGPAKLARARQELQRLREVERHYVRKENILFPLLERHGFMGPSAVMWAIHDDIRAGWKKLDGLLAAGPGGDPGAWSGQLSEVFGGMSTAMREMFYKEEHILFPAALEKLSEEEWMAIRSQEADVGYCYVQPGDQWPSHGQAAAAPEPAPAAPQGGERLLSLTTGALTPEQIDLVFSHLPVEISFVDKDDAVRFFTQGEERIFPRSAAVIGRKVQKCHPPASLHRVQQIVDDFRAGRRSAAEFWIQMRGKFIHIRYFAVRDTSGSYQGTLEVVQDVTAIRALEGERRLLEDAQ